MATAADIQNLIVLEVGDTDTLLLTTQMATIWASYADKALVAPRLQELYAKRRCIDLILATLRQKTDFITAAGLTVKLDQQFTHLTAMRGEVQTEISLIERRARSARSPVLAALTTTTPVAPPVNGFDASDPRYAGSPYVTPVVTGVLP